MERAHGNQAVSIVFAGVGPPTLRPYETIRPSVCPQNQGQKIPLSAYMHWDAT